MIQTKGYQEKRRIIEISDQHRRQRHYVKHVRLNLNFSMSVSDGFFFLQHCSFYNAWLQLSEKHVELIISYQGFSTIVFLLAIASRTSCTFMDYSLATSSSNAFSRFISVLNNIFNRTLKNENVRTTVIVISYKGILFKQNTLSLLGEKKDERIRIPPFASIITSEMTAILFIYWQTVAIVAAILF